MIKRLNELNKISDIPYILIINNNNFEYFVYIHCSNYNNSGPEIYICNHFGYNSLSEYKSEEELYTLKKNWWIVLLWDIYLTLDGEK